MRTFKTSLRNVRMFPASSVIPNLGVMVLNLSKPAAVKAVTPHGEEITLGYGTEFRLQTDAISYSCGAPCSLDITERMTFKAEETLTNLERVPALSPAEQAVTLALRMFNRKQKEQRREQERLRLQERAAKEQQEATAKAGGEGAAPDTSNSAPDPEEPAAAH